MASGDWTVLVVAGEVLLVSLIVVAVLVWLLRRARKQIEAERARADLLARRQAVQFLDREMASNRDLLQRGVEAALQRLLTLRQHWLELEQKALHEEGAVASDPALLARHAEALLAFVEAKGAGAEHPPPDRANRDGTGTLAQARAVIELQKEIITTLKGKLEVLGRDSIEGAANVSPAPSGGGDQAGALVRAEQQLKAVRENYQRVSDELARLQWQRAQSGPASGDSAMLVVNSGGFNVDTARTLVDEMEVVHAGSLEELQRLRQTNARQRGLILELERDLSLLRTQPGEATDASQKLFETLKVQLRDYENCTAVLEMETENLRARIEALNKVIAAAEQSGSADASAQLRHALDQLAQMEQRVARYRVSTMWVCSVAQADSLERGAALLRDNLAELQPGFFYFIRGNEQHYWLSSNSGGVIDERVRKLLQSAVPEPGTVWLPVADGALFVGVVLRVFLAESATNFGDFDKLLNFLGPTLQILDVLLMSLDARGTRSAQLLKLENTLAQVGRQLAGIDAQHHYLSEENARIGDNLKQEMAVFFASVQLTDIQRECVEAMLTDFEEELGLLSKASTAIHTSLQKVLGSIDVGSGRE